MGEKSAPLRSLFGDVDHGRSREFGRVLLRERKRTRSNNAELRQVCPRQAIDLNVEIYHCTSVIEYLMGCVAPSPCKKSHFKGGF